MKVSVITVAFNAEATIADTLASVAAQTHPDIEHIVIDGASKDATLEIVQKHGAHVTRVLSEPDQGIYDAMNKGIRLATGDIVGVLNADDIYANNTIVARIHDLMAARALDALYGDIAFVDAADPLRINRIYSSARFRPDRIGWGWMPAHPSLFLRRAVYDRFGLFRTDYRIAGDFEYIARIFATGSLNYDYLPEVTVRMRTGGVSTGGWRNTLLLNREVLRACRDNQIPTNSLKLMTKYPLKIMEFLRR